MRRESSRTNRRDPSHTPRGRPRRTCSIHVPDAWPNGSGERFPESAVTASRLLLRRAEMRRASCVAEPPEMPAIRRVRAAGFALTALSPVC